MTETPFYPTPETKLCLSLAQSPSQFGSRFHNHIFRDLKLNYFYLARRITDLPQAIQSLRALNVHGCAVTMPFKSAALPLMDQLDELAEQAQALNTILNHEGRLLGHNTDVMAVAGLLREQGISPHDAVDLIGSGGMASAVVLALKRHGCRQVSVWARNPTTGRQLAQRFGFQFRDFSLEFKPTGKILIQSSALGFKEHETFQFPVPDSVLQSYAQVWDVVASPLETNLIRRARTLGLNTVSGPEITCRQAVHQFELYTGITPPRESVMRAFQWATST